MGRPAAAGAGGNCVHASIASDARSYACARLTAGRAFCISLSRCAATSCENAPPGAGMTSSNVIYAIIGTCLAVLLTIGLLALQPDSGDPTIQPEGEPDPGKHS
jgi:hypothetical protein